MQLLDQAEAHRALGHLFPRLDAVMRGAWQQWLDVRMGRNFSKRTRANIVYDETITLARRLLPECEEVVVQEQHIFVFDGQYAIRFKKLNSDLTSSNVRTRQNKMFRRQECLDGMPLMHNLEAGYLLNQLQTTIVSTHLVCPSGVHSHAWQLSLEADVINVPTADVLPFPVSQQSLNSVVQFRKKTTEKDNEVASNSDESDV